MTDTARRIAHKLYDYKPTPDEQSRADELREMADAITPEATLSMATSERHRAWIEGRQSAADRLRERADAILAGGA